MARPVGSTTRPQFYTYISEHERKEYVKWLKSVYKKPDYKDLAKWYGDQMFGKAIQPIGNGPDNKEFPAPITNVFRDNSDTQDNTSKEAD